MGQAFTLTKTLHFKEQIKRNNWLEVFFSWQQVERIGLHHPPTFSCCSLWVYITPWPALSAICISPYMLSLWGSSFGHQRCQLISNLRTRREIFKLRKEMGRGALHSAAEKTKGHFFKKSSQQVSDYFKNLPLLLLYLLSLPCSLTGLTVFPVTETWIVIFTFSTVNSAFSQLQSNVK